MAMRTRYVQKSLVSLRSLVAKVLAEETHEKMAYAIQRAILEVATIGSVHVALRIIALHVKLVGVMMGLAIVEVLYNIQDTST